MASCYSLISSTCGYHGLFNAAALSTLSRVARSGGQGCPSGVASPAPPVAASDAVWGLSGAFGGSFWATAALQFRTQLYNPLELKMTKPSIALSKQETELLIEHFVVRDQTSIIRYDGHFNGTYQVLERLTKAAKFVAIAGKVYQMLGVQPARSTGGRDAHTVYEIRIEKLDSDLTPNPNKVLNIDTPNLPWLVSGVSVQFSSSIKNSLSEDMACRLALMGGPLAVFKAEIKESSIDLSISGYPTIYLSRKNAEEFLLHSGEHPHASDVFEYLEKYPEQREQIEALFEEHLLKRRKDEIRSVKCESFH